jgi:hypothetical protein
MSAGGDDIWGYDPMILSRYARFIAFTQGMDPEEMMVSRGMTKLSPLFSMLRLRYVFRPDIQRSQLFASPIGELPRALLVSRWRVLADERDMLKAMGDPAFDPREVVLLETSPDPVPVVSAKRGSVSVVDLSTDAMEIRADVPEPAILLLTDNYSSGWRVTALNAGGGQTYSVMPANYTLRAIALGAGEHHLRLEYVPRAFIVGKWITLLSLLAFAAGCGLLLWRGPSVTGIAASAGVLGVASAGVPRRRRAAR